MKNRAARTGAALALAFAVLIAAACGEGLRYSPYGDPGAVHVAVGLLLAAAAIGVIPVLLAARGLIRAVRRDLAGMPPQQQALLVFAAAEGAHLLLENHNRKVSEQLAASVMGPERDA